MPQAAFTSQDKLLHELRNSPTCTNWGDALGQRFARPRKNSGKFLHSSMEISNLHCPSGL